MNKNIIERVKEILGLNGDYSYIYLLETLSKKRAECHPDKFHQIEQKQAKEEEFKYLNSLLIQLKKYLEQNNNKLPVVSGHEENENYSLQLIKAIGNISDLNDKICSLERDTEWKDYEIKKLTAKINDLEDKKYEEESANIKFSLQEIYKSSIQSKITPGISFLALVITQMKSVKNSLVDIFGNQTFITIIILCIFIVSLLNIIYKSLLKYRIFYLQNKLTNVCNLNDLPLHYINSNKLCFTENDIVEYSLEKMTLLDEIIFWGNDEIVYRQLTNFVILHLNKKQVIKSVRIEKLIHIFEINHSFIDNDTPF